MEPLQLLMVRGARAGSSRARSRHARGVARARRHKPNSCCYPSEEASLLAKWNAETITDFSSECEGLLNFLYCYPCHPSQSEWFSAEHSTLHVCESFCDRLYSTCGDAIYKSQKIKVAFSSGTHMCKLLKFDVEDDDETGCFDFDDSAYGLARTLAVPAVREECARGRPVPWLAAVCTLVAVAALGLSDDAATRRAAPRTSRRRAPPRARGRRDHDGLAAHRGGQRRARRRDREHDCHPVGHSHVESFRRHVRATPFHHARLVFCRGGERHEDVCFDITSARVGAGRLSAATRTCC